MDIGAFEAVRVLRPPAPTCHQKRLVICEHWYSPGKLVI